MLKDIPLVTIICSCFNHENYVIDSLNSILAQTYPVIQLIIVDDFSDAQCIEKLDKLEAKNLIVIKSDSNSGGCAKPRNLGISASSGEIVAFLDSDDKWNEDHLRVSLNRVINGNPCANARIASFYPKLVTNRSLLIRNLLIGSSVIIPRNLIRESEFFPVYSDNSIYEDYVAWLKICKKKIAAYGQKNVFVIWNNTKNSLSKPFMRKLIDAFKVYYSYEKLPVTTSLIFVFRLSLNYLIKNVKYEYKN
jgi:glycosyltransferase involved in cell wall biosynthesis